jgi:2,3-bisphosphoglycerate-dependent phosphoglycerate mutase
MMDSTSARGPVLAADPVLAAGRAGPESGDDRELWLVRHGESTWNVLGLVQGHCDQARLTRRGIVQARAVAADLGARPIGTLYVSDLRRARQTAAPLAAALGRPVIRDARLRERRLGVWEGTSLAALPTVASGLRGGRVADPDARPEGGESLRDFYHRVAAFAGDLAVRHADGPGAPAGDIAVVAHGGTLRMLTAWLHGVSVEEMGWEPLGNVCIRRFPAGLLALVMNR